MRRSRPFLLALALLGASVRADDLPRGAVIPGVPCAEAPGCSYALYLPAAYTPERRWPVLYLMDPNGRGALPMPLVSATAERLGWIVASSNDTQGDGPLERMTKPFLAMLADTHARLAIDDARLFLGGFSAGARLSAFLGQVLRTPPAGVIACGAGFLDGHPPARGNAFAWVGTTGTRDFNYVEMKRLAPELERARIPHRLLLFDGVHQWPPAELLAEAMEFLEAVGRARAGVAAPRLLETFAERARADEKSGRPLEALERWEAMARDLAPLGDVSEAKARAAALRADPAVKKLLKDDARRDERDARAMGRLEGVIVADFGEDPPPAASRILLDIDAADLRARAGAGAPEERASAERILAALRAKLGFYLPRDLEEKGDTRRAALARQVAAALGER